MKGVLLTLLLCFLIGIIVLSYLNHTTCKVSNGGIISEKKEGFEGGGAGAGTGADAQTVVNNISSPLARDINPLQKGFAEIGISSAKANEIKANVRAGLNLPEIEIVGDGTRRLVQPSVQNEARVDDEDSFLGTVAFCAKQGRTENPFSDPRFATSCGMCMTKGKLLTGESFSVPTGVVVFPADREKALKDMKTNGYLYPRVIPSMNAALCEGASVGDDAKPSLALTSQQYMDYKSRANCLKQRTVGEKGCAQCFNTDTYTYVGENPGVEPLTLTLYGLGLATVKSRGIVQGKEKTPLSLSTPTIIDMKRILEGQIFEITVEQGETNGPRVSGFFSSALANGSKFQMPLENLALVDKQTGAAPRRTGFLYSPAYGNRLVVLSGGPQKSMLSMDITLPFTFLESDEIGTYDCPSAPLMRLKESASQFSTDPCTKGNPGSYSAECLRQRILDAGCTPLGDAYKNPQQEAGNLGISAFIDKILRYANMKDIDREAAAKCTGQTAALTTPCDAFLSGAGARAAGSGSSLQACLSFLYKNESDGTPVGKAYSGVSSLAYTSTNPKTGKPSYCSDSGTLNPSNSKELEGVFTNGYKSKKGIEAVKNYISDIFLRATDDGLAATVSDASGGRATSIAKCFKGIGNFPEYGILGAQEYIKLYKGVPGLRPVVVLGPVGMDPWGRSWGIRADSFPDRDAKWIWSKARAQINEPSWETYQFTKKYRNTTGAPIKAELHCVTDNTGSISVNDAQIGGLSGYTKHSVVFPVGESLIQINAANQGGPAGFLMTALEAGTRKALFQTNNTWMMR